MLHPHLHLFLALSLCTVSHAIGAAALKSVKPRTSKAQFRASCVICVDKKSGKQSAYLQFLPQIKTSKEEKILWQSSIISALTTNDYLVTVHNRRRYFIFTDRVNNELVDTPCAKQLIARLIRAQKSTQPGSNPLLQRLAPARRLPEYERDYEEVLALFLEKYRSDVTFKEQMNDLHLFFMLRKHMAKKSMQHAERINRANPRFSLAKFAYARIEVQSATQDPSSSTS